MRSRNVVSLVFLMVFLLSGGAVAAVPSSDAPGGGTMIATMNGEPVHLPSLNTRISGEIDGDLASVTVVQTFVNPTGRPLNARYLFPLNKEAAVYAMTMEVGGEVVKAVIMKKPDAQATYAKAQQAGKAASLLTQHRPNMFTQDIANLMPDQPITVTLRYTHPVAKQDGAYELVIPLVVGPRYEPASPRVLSQLAMGSDTPLAEPPADVAPDKAVAAVPVGQWGFGAMPTYPEVAGLTIPKEINAERVSIAITLRAGFPIQSVDSSSHRLAMVKEGDSRRVTLADGATIDNRDFVLRYRLAGEDIQSGFMQHRDGEDGYFSLLIEPPLAPQAQSITPRELVFVVDTSGSMRGTPMRTSKMFMAQALQGLRHDDYFRIIRFSGTASEFAAGPVRATPENKRAGLDYVQRLDAGGGTEVLKAIDRAFSGPESADRLRIVVFLSDGYVSNDPQIIYRIGELAGDTRVYAFGIGSAVNRYLLTEMARKARGYARVIDPSDDVTEAAIGFARTLQSPVLTDIRIDWGEMNVFQTTPAAIPDLFAGGSVRVLGRFRGTGAKRITVHGRSGGRDAVLALDLDLGQGSIGDSGAAGGRAIPLAWARARVDQYMDQLLTPASLRRTGLDDGQLEEEITRLGLGQGLMTQFTSFVAVSEKVVNDDPGAAADAQVSLPMVKGVSGGAYPNAAATQQAFSGGATPEPETWAAMIVLAVMAFYVFRRRPLI